MDCQREHWIATARVYDDGTLIEPTVGVLDGEPDPDTGLDDRSHYFLPNPAREVGFLRITFWGHDRDVVLAAVRERFDAEQRKQEETTP